MAKFDRINSSRLSLQLYLRQSDYFSSMFSGSWKESEASRISVSISRRAFYFSTCPCGRPFHVFLFQISIADPNVTEESLHIALGSLYQDEVTFEPAKV